MLTLFAFSRSCHMCVLVVLQLIQRRCKVCGGNGLVQRGKYQRKCPGKHVQQGTGGSQAVLDCACDKTQGPALKVAAVFSKYSNSGFITRQCCLRLPWCC